MEKQEGDEVLVVSALLLLLLLVLKWHYQRHYYRFLLSLFIHYCYISITIILYFVTQFSIVVIIVYDGKLSFHHYHIITP